MLSWKNATRTLTSTLNFPDMEAEWARYTLDFKFTARTSRESMTRRPTYYVRIPRCDGNGYGVGECALFRGLSADDVADYEERLADACRRPMESSGYSSIDCGLEAALIDAGYVPRIETPFSRGLAGIAVNGLIWMGTRREMYARIDDKLAAGFRVLKIKIGGIDFEDELAMLGYVRDRYKVGDLELRLDANGSFTAANALERLKRISDYDIHSIEQPVMAGQTELMAELCRCSPVDIALDEELIGSPVEADFHRILDVLAPKYIILKPTLCGGFAAADRWIAEASRRGID